MNLPDFILVIIGNHRRIRRENPFSNVATATIATEIIETPQPEAILFCAEISRLSCLFQGETFLLKEITFS